VFGFAFKKNTNDTRMTQSAFIIDYLSKIEGINVHIHDPKVTKASFEWEMDMQGFELK